MPDPITKAIIKAVEQQQAAVKRQIEVVAAAKAERERLAALDTTS